MASDQSEARQLVESLVRRLGPVGARRYVDTCLASCTRVELASLAMRWSFWARPKQLPPSGRWRSWGYLTGRGFGKTLSVSNLINHGVHDGRYRLIGLCAQDEDASVEIQVEGPSGLIATAPPWFRPEWHSSDLELVWPNGAKAYVKTPESPGKIRGLEYDLSWLTEIQSWPRYKMHEAYSNFELSTRTGPAQLVWDATPKRGHPILKDLIARAEQDPERHHIVRGTTHENSANLAEGYVEELERRYGGTSKGREELLGEMLDESENALFSQTWIERSRRHAPDSYKRRVIGVDAAVTKRAGNDRTGIIDCGLGHDDQAYIIGDLSGRYAPAQWAKVVVDRYVYGRCDCVVVETNKGGDLIAQNLRAYAATRGIHVVVLGKHEIPRHDPTTIYIREVHARGAKEDRAQPLATAYERGRVSHVNGVDLSDFEETITTWEPSPGHRSPDALDAAVHGVGELLGFGANAVDNKAGFVGLDQIAKMATETMPHASIASLLIGGDGGGTI
jgi:phage terminase large subunit-like protein